MCKAEETCEIIEELKKFNINFKDEQGNWRSTQDVLKDIINA